MAKIDDDAGATPPVRDVRIDQVGFAGELDKHFIDPLKQKLRDAHPVGTRLAGDFFEGVISPNDRRQVNAAGWLRAYEAQEIDRATFLAAVSVSVTAAEKALAARTFKRLVKTESGKPKVLPSRIVEAPFELVTAIRALGQTIDAAPRAAA